MKNDSPFRITNSHRTERRGILLLVVLGLLTLFLFVGTAFVVSSNQYRQANRSYQKADQARNIVATEHGFLDEVLNQLIRDTTNQNSALRFHSLLRDMYGTDGIVVPSNNPALATTAPINANFNVAGAYSSLGRVNGGVTGGQFLEFTLADNYQDLLGVAYSAAPDARPYSSIDNAYTGLLVTFLSGPVAGHTTRIVGYHMVPSNSNPSVQIPLVRIANFPAEDGHNISSKTINQLNDPQNPTRILINGRPFNGTGVGYNPNVTNPNVAKLSAQERVNGTDREIALMPNAVFFNPDMVDDWNSTRVTPGYFHPATDPNSPQYNATVERLFEGFGGSDESYDAADFQNMYLAWSPPVPQETAWPNPSDTPPSSLGSTVIPSFHRPALINYWAAKFVEDGTGAPNVTNSTLGTQPVNAALLRKIMLRPNWFDHPNFTGSNPDLTGLTNSQKDNGLKLARMIYGPWDVDNDRDGVRDSVWIDFGAPVMVGPNGRMVKPLAAIMVQDLDGRLNVNAHGTRETAGLNGEPPEILFAGNVESDDAPRGQAYGPADVKLREFLDRNVMRRLFSGFARDFNNDSLSDEVFAGRYGRPGTDDDEPGEDDDYDLAAQLGMQGYPGADQRMRSNFGTLPDLRCRYSLGLNAVGQAVTDYPVNRASEFTLLTEDNPYELDLSATGPRGAGGNVDSPYSLGELERLLRAYDVDAGSLPPRLFENLKGNDSSFNLGAFRALLTTDSYDIPEPGFQMPEWVTTNALGAGRDFATIMGRPPINATFADLIEYRLRAEQNWPVSTDASNPTRLVTLRQQMAQLCAPEMMAGMKLNLNRPLGNGRDDNNNGVVDEPGEYYDANADGLYTPGEGEGASWLFDRARMQGSARDNPALDNFESTTTASYLDAFDRNGDGQIQNFEWGDTNGDNQLSQMELVNLHNFRRQLLARYLYVMAAAVVDPAPSTLPPTKLQARAREFAQWAINVVDFRDPDNIMTAFEYDPNPFDGWAPDGDLSTTADELGADNKLLSDDDTLVWGLERPEVLMTETLAWHDRATEDRGVGFEDAVTDENLDGKLNSEDEGEVGTQAAPGRDTDYDQRVRPQGATFVELYNPWASSPGANADTHLVNPTTGDDLGVDLSAVDEVTGNSPVWRINVRKTVDFVSVGGSPRESRFVGGPDRDPDDPNYNVRPRIPDRTVYFTNFDPDQIYANSGREWDDDGVAFFSSLVWLPANRDPTNFNLSDQTQFSTYANSASVVGPGKYMLVGSGRLFGGNYEARIGEKKRTSPGAPRAIVLNPAAIGVKGNGIQAVMLRDDTGSPVQDQANFSVSATTATTSVSIIDSVWLNDHVEQRRFSVSEPANGYPDGVFNSAWTGTSYDDPTGVYKPALDIPLDNQRSSARVFGTGTTVDNQSVIGSTSEIWKRKARPTDKLATIQMRKDNDLRLTLPEREETSVRTIPAFSWLYLQRLANPLLPWNPEPTLSSGQPNPRHDPTMPVNPYRTIDSMGVNVTVFNGQAEQERRKQGGKVFTYNNSDAIQTFSSVQRGRFNESDLENMVGRIRDTQGPPPFGSSTAQNTGFRNMRINTAKAAGFIRDPHAGGGISAQLAQNLWGEEHIGQAGRGGQTRIKPIGVWLNRGGPTGDGYWRSRSSATHYMNSVPDCTLGFMNEPFRNANATNDLEQKFVPAQPFPWITWNNRPFANAGELMQVPAFRSSQLLKVFSYQKPGNGNNGEYSEQYSGSVRDGTYPKDGIKPQLYPELTVDGPYGHLPNFFRVEPNGRNGEGVAGLYRVLDLVEVPSRFVGTETWLNPAAFGSSLVTNIFDPRYQLQPPFNHISARREPGKVNINTIAGDAGGAVWHAIFHGSAKRDGRRDGHPVVDDDDFFSFRRGYGQLNDGPTKLDANSPTLFANPFRAADAGDLVPTNALLRSALDSTLLRSTALPTSLNPTRSPSKDPLFTTEINKATYDAIQDPNYKFMHRDSDRNPYFRYSPIDRLTSMTTTRSNVFAVWITVGFFEVEEVTPWASLSPADQLKYGTVDVYNRVYADGYMFGKEAGIDTGDVKRVRMFAIVDRTIPVGFEPGANLNLKDTIRLRSRIEE